MFDFKKGKYCFIVEGRELNDGVFFGKLRVYHKNFPYYFIVDNRGGKFWVEDSPYESSPKYVYIPDDTLFFVRTDRKGRPYIYVDGFGGDCRFDIEDWCGNRMYEPKSFSNSPACLLEVIDRSKGGGEGRRISVLKAGVKVDNEMLDIKNHLDLEGNE